MGGEPVCLLDRRQIVFGAQFPEGGDQLFDDCQSLARVRKELTPDMRGFDRINKNKWKQPSRNLAGAGQRQPADRASEGMTPERPGGRSPAINASS